MERPLMPWGHANPNHNGYLKKKTMASVSEHVEKPEPSCWQEHKMVQSLCKSLLLKM